MSTPTTPDLPEPSPEELERAVADLEKYVADQAPAPLPVVEAVELPTPRRGRQLDGRTKDVADLAAELAEARRKGELLAEGDPRLVVPTKRVLRAQRKAAEAWQLREAGQSPALLALRDARVRLWSTVLVMVSAVFGLAWSASGVRDSVMLALNILAVDAGAWLAWLVEPALSLTLLATVGVQAYAAMRGRPVDRNSAAGTTLRRTEAVTLGLILVLNCWSALPWVAERFDLLPLLVHALGPIAAVVGVRTLPALWSILGCLPVPVAGRVTEGVTGPKYSGNGLAGVGVTEGLTAPGEPSHLVELVARARRLIDAGQLPSQPSAKQVRTALGCGTDAARTVRDELSGGAA